MSESVRKAIEQLSINIERNSAYIDNALRKAGIEPNAALVFSTAKYFDALNKLAEE
ncbi:MAG: hypothetical protein WA755_12660 [Candidatus Acidiferrales bacterium]